MPPAPLIEQPECAKLLGIHPRTLERLRSLGFIGYHRVGRRVFFTPSDIEAFLESTHVAPRTAHVEQLAAVS